MSFKKQNLNKKKKKILLSRCPALLDAHRIANYNKLPQRDILKVVEEYESLTDDQLKQQMIQSQME